MHPIKLTYDERRLPSFFDARRKWKLEGGAKDQGWCASSWAFSTVALVEDRSVFLILAIPEPKLTLSTHSHFFIFVVASIIVV